MNNTTQKKDIVKTLLISSLEEYIKERKVGKEVAGLIKYEVSQWIRKKSTVMIMDSSNVIKLFKEKTKKSLKDGIKIIKTCNKCKKDFLLFNDEYYNFNCPFCK